MTTVRQNLSFSVSDKMLRRMVGSLAYQMNQDTASGAGSSSGYDRDTGRKVREGLMRYRKRCETLTILTLARSAVGLILILILILQIIKILIILIIIFILILC